MRIDLKNFTTPSIPFMVFFGVGALLFWVLTYIGDFYSADTSFVGLKSVFSNGTLLWQNALSILFATFNSVLILRFLSRYVFVNTRTFMPVFIFILLLVTWQSVHSSYISHIILSIFIISLYQFLGMYNDTRSVERAFLGSFLIGISGLLVHEFFLVIVVCWIGFILLRSFSLRTFLASLVGLAVPFILYTAVKYMFFSVVSFSELFEFNFNWGFSFNFPIFSIHSLYILILVVVFLISIVGLLSDLNSYANNARRHIGFMFILIVFFVSSLTFGDQFSPVFLPFIAFAYSILTAHIFSAKKSLFYSIVFIVFCVTNLLYMAYNFIF